MIALQLLLVGNVNDIVLVLEQYGRSQLLLLLRWRAVELLNTLTGGHIMLGHCDLLLLLFLTSSSTVLLDIGVDQFLNLLLEGGSRQRVARISCIIRIGQLVLGSGQLSVRMG